MRDSDKKKKNPQFSLLHVYSLNFKKRQFLALQAHLLQNLTPLLILFC